MIIVLQGEDDVVAHLVNRNVFSQAVAETREGDKAILSNSLPLLEDSNQQLDDLRSLIRSELVASSNKNDLQNATQVILEIIGFLLATKLVCISNSLLQGLQDVDHHAVQLVVRILAAVLCQSDESCESGEGHVDTRTITVFSVGSSDQLLEEASKVRSQDVSSFLIEGCKRLGQMINAVADLVCDSWLILECSEKNGH